MRPTAMVRRVCAAGVVIASAIAVPTVTAQTVPSPVSIDGPVRRSTPKAVPRWEFDQCMGGLSYGAPLKWALSYGLGLVRESAQRDWCLLGAAKVGFGGASMNVGLANALGHWGSGVSLTGGVLRTFNDPMGALAKRTYVGGSLHVWPILALGGEIGVYRRLGTDAPGTSRNRTLLTWSTGFGF